MAEVETRLLIGGDLAAGSGPPLEVENPATEETLATVATASPEDVDATVAAASEAQRVWRELGREGLEAFQETKHVHIDTEIAPKEWWYPYSEYSRARDGAPDEGASR